MSTTVKLNVDELKNLVTYMVKNNSHIQDSGKVPVAINVESPAGIGKTSVITQLADELGMDFVKINLSQIEEIGDLVGFPVKEFEIRKEDNSIKWVPETMLPMYIQAKYSPTGNKRMSYAPPAWIQGKEKPIMLLLDDYSRGDQRFMQATMEIIDRQEYISWKMPKGSMVILSSNPDNGEYFVTTLDNAQKTRFITINMQFDIDCWARYAEQNQIDSRCINFLIMHPELVTEQTNARVITTFFNSISSIGDFDKQLPLIQMLGEGSVGPEFSTLFTMFINNKLDKLIHPKEILSGADWKAIRTKLAGTIGIGDDYRADIAGVISTRIINFTMYQTDAKSNGQKLVDRIIEICTDEDLFTADLRYYMVKAIVNHDKQRFQKILMHPKLIQVAIK
jgi:hypothetical protein